MGLWNSHSGRHEPQVHRAPVRGPALPAQRLLPMPRVPGPLNFGASGNCEASGNIPSMGDGLRLPAGRWPRPLLVSLHAGPQVILPGF